MKTILTKILNRDEKRTQPFNEYSLACLNGNDVITAEISDHHPVINNILFWNVMMKGMRRGNGGGYNNGFKLEENDHQYVRRLTMIACVIAEIVYHHPQIYAIALCEGPVKTDHVNKLFSVLQQFVWMKRLTASTGFYKPDMPSYQPWGLLMLADQNYKVNKVTCQQAENCEVKEKIANRFQIWELEQNKQKRYLALAHFPFSGDEHATSKSDLSTHGKIYCYLTAAVLHQYANDSMVFCADFNINPYLISDYNDRYLDKVPHNNSALSLLEGNKSTGEKFHTVTVDGVLLSHYEKRLNLNCKNDSHLFFRLAKERDLSTANFKLISRL